MRTIWHSLAWKEWHEHKWKLAAIVTILAGCVAMVWRGEETQLFSLLPLAIILPIIPLSVLIAAASATSERSRGTLPFLSALPISQRKVAVAKLVFGLGTCLIPVLIVLLGMYGWYLSWGWLGLDYDWRMAFSWRELHGPFDVDNWFIELALVVTLWVVSLFLWTAAAGVNRADEVSAGAMALSVMAGVWLVMIATAIWLANEHFAEWLQKEGAWLNALASAALPGGFAQSKELALLGGPLAVAVLCLFVTVHSGLAGWFVLRFGRVADGGIRSRQNATSKRRQFGWLPPRSTPLSAIAWKQFRESGPIVLAGLGGVAMIVVAALLATSQTLHDSEEAVDVFAVTTFFGCLYLGGFTTLVVGIGVYLRDLSPGLHAFWRSRPISPHGWYWLKFVFGIAIVILTFQLPMFFLPAFASADQVSIFGGTTAIFRMQLIGLAAFVAVYGVAVAMTCLMRNAVYASVLTFAVLYSGMLMAMAAVYLAQRLTGQVRPKFLLDEPEGTPIWLAELVILAVISAVVGWLAVRNDWGRKSRY